MQECKNAGNSFETLSMGGCVHRRRDWVAAGFAQQAGPAEPFVAWAREHAIRIQTIEAGHGSSDLEPLKAVIGRARVVALGESSHGIHEFLTFRNRLFEFLVQKLGFTALAVETGFAESIQVNDFINGGPGDSKTATQNVFSYAPVAFDENRELIEWMRRYNAGVAAARKIARASSLRVRHATASVDERQSGRRRSASKASCRTGPG